MAPFLRLLRKDLETSRWSVGVFSGIMFGLMVYIRFKISSGKWPYQALGFFFLVPAIIGPIWLLWQSFQTLRSEWREDTIYTLLTLPVSGWKILLAKLCAICLEYTVFVIVSLVGLLVLFPFILTEASEVVPSLGWLAWNGFLVYLVSLFFLISVVIFIQLAFVVGKMVGRFQTIISLWVLFLASWFVTILSRILAPALRWLPPLSLHKIMRLHQLERSIVFEWYFSSQLGGFLAIVGLFFLASYLLENYTEITA